MSLYKEQMIGLVMQWLLDIARVKFTNVCYQNSPASRAMNWVSEYDNRSEDHTHARSTGDEYKKERSKKVVEDRDQ